MESAVVVYISQSDFLLSSNLPLMLLLLGISLQLAYSYVFALLCIIAFPSFTPTLRY